MRRLLVQPQQTRSPVHVARDEAGEALEFARQADAAWRAERNRRWQHRLDRIDAFLDRAEAWVTRFGPLVTLGVVAVFVTTVWIRYMDGAWWTPWLRPTFFAFILLGFPLFLGVIVRAVVRVLRRGMGEWARSQLVDVSDIAADELSTSSVAASPDSDPDPLRSQAPDP